MWIVNIHAHPNRQELRDAEALVLAAELDELMKVSEHVVVLGDYNSPVGTVIHNMLQEKVFLNTMELAGGGVTHTMTNRQGDGVLSIDHIYVSESLIGRVSSSRVVNDPGFRLPKAPSPDVWVQSDHLPVMADLSCNKTHGAAPTEAAPHSTCTLQPLPHQPDISNTKDMVIALLDHEGNTCQVAQARQSELLPVQVQIEAYLLLTVRSDQCRFKLPTRGCRRFQAGLKRKGLDVLFRTEVESDACQGSQN